MWSVLLRFRWRYRRAEWESLAEDKIIKLKAGPASPTPTPTPTP